MLDRLRTICPSLLSVYVKGEWSRTNPLYSLSSTLADLDITPRTSEDSSSSGTQSSSSRQGLATHWMYSDLTGEWKCLGDVDLTATSLLF